MSLSKHLLALLLTHAISSCSSAPAAADSTPCVDAFFANRGISVDELVEKADIIALASAEEFVTDGSNPPYDGYYVFAPGEELKGHYQRQIKVWGSEPYERIPQFYIDITEMHGIQDTNRLYGGTTGIIETKNGCFLNPRFSIGWEYLLILGVNSEMAFEPVHSPTLDEWYKSVKTAASKLE